MDEEFDNFIMIPTEQETPEDIIEDYVQGALACQNENEMQALITMLYQELVLRIAKDYHIHQGLGIVESLKQIQDDINDLSGDVDEE